MTVSAYVLIQTDVGKAAAVASTVGAIEGVQSAENVTGPYDVVVKVEADSIDEVARTVVGRIQLVDGITRTITCEVVHL